MKLNNVFNGFDRKMLDEAIKDAMKNGFKKDPNAKEITIKKVSRPRKKVNNEYRNK